MCVETERNDGTPTVTVAYGGDETAETMKATKSAMAALEPAALAKTFAKSKK